MANLNTPPSSIVPKDGTASSPVRDRESAIAGATTALDAMPKQNEFTHTPGAIDEATAKAQGKCVAEKYYGLTPQKIDVTQSPGETRISVDGADGKRITIEQQTGSSINVPLSNGEISAFNRSSFKVDANNYARLSSYTYANGSKSLSAQVEVPTTLLPSTSKFGLPIEQSAKPVSDGSLANGPVTLMREGPMVIAQTMNILGTPNREATAPEQRTAQAVLEKAVNAGVKCGILKPSGQ